MKKYFDNYFDMIYFINFPDRVDKYENVMTMFNKLGIEKYKHIIPLSSDIDFGINNILPPTAKSCKLTHMSCFQDAITNDYKKILIFEDDFCFNLDDKSIEENLEYHLEVCFTFLENFRWDLFYFDNIIETVKKNNKMVSFTRETKKSDTPFLKIKGKHYVHSYALTNFACQELIKEHNNNSLWNDQSINKVKLDHKYIYLPGLFDQLLNLETDHLWNNSK